MPATSKPGARRAAPRRAAGLIAAALLVPLAACQGEPPEERVARLRADYTAELNSFQVRERPVAPTGPAPGEAEPAEPDATDPDATGPDAVPPLPDETTVERDVLLDIMLRNRGDETLPGITLDIEQVDAQERVKAHYKVYVEADGAHPGGQPAAVTHVLEDVDFAPGDKFGVEVRPVVGQEARTDYREFLEAADGSAP